MRLTQSKWTVLSAAAIFAATPVVWAGSGSGSNNGADSQQQQQQSSQANESNGGQSNGQQAQGHQQRAPKGWVLVEEDVVMQTAREPQNHFMDALRDLSQNDNKGAASELRIAANYMKLQASRGDNQDTQELDKCVQEVEQTAKQISGQNGDQKKDANELKQTFTRANLALAQFFQSKADSEVNGQRPVMAGHDLRAADNCLESAFAWSGRQIPAKANTTISNAQELADYLVSPEPSRQQNNAENGQRNQNENQNKGESAGNAQQASAQEQPGSMTEASVPSNAAQTVNALGKTIQNCMNKIGDSNSSNNSSGT